MADSSVRASPQNVVLMGRASKTSVEMGTQLIPILGRERAMIFSRFAWCFCRKK